VSEEFSLGKHPAPARGAHRAQPASGGEAAWDLPQPRPEAGRTPEDSAAVAPPFPPFPGLEEAEESAGGSLGIDPVRYLKGLWRRRFLVAGIVLAGIQMFASLQLRGAAEPTNMRLYFTAFTLLIFLLFRLPPLWNKGYFDPANGNDSGNTTAGLTAFLMGAVVLTTSLWAGPSHTFGGQNWTMVWNVPMTVTGVALILAGIILLALGMTPRTSQIASESHSITH